MPTDTLAADAGIGVVEFSIGQPSLDEVFFALTGKPAEEPAAEPEEVRV